MDNIIRDGAGTIEIPAYQAAAHCLICGKEVIISDFYRYPMVCDECKRAVELVKMHYKNKPCWNCNDPECGVCNRFIVS